MDDPIFIHSSWRAASTYVWSKFRDRPDAYCYFEPLNEHLTTLTSDFVDWFRPWSFAHHPKLEAPYLEEFRPLIRNGAGIPRFPSHLSYGRYCAGPDVELPELAAYLGDLAGFAARLGRRPVYGFVRTNLRVGWFRARMPGRNIFVRRLARRQFLSFLAQATHKNPYFLQRGLVILLHNMDEPLFVPLFRAIDIRKLVGSDELRDLLAGRGQHEATLRALYIVFYYMHLQAIRLGEAEADLVIDIDRLMLEAPYRAETEARLHSLIGMAISFADCAAELYEAPLGWSNGFFDKLEREVEAIDAALSAAHPAPNPRIRCRSAI
jgi:hypothetical protein